MQLEQGLLTLHSPTDILIAPGKVREALQSHRVFTVAASSSMGGDQQKRVISMAEQKQRNLFMQHLKV